MSCKDRLTDSAKRSSRAATGLGLIVLVLLCGAPHAGAQLGTQTNWHLHLEDRSWLQPSDPTLLAPRLTTQWEHEDLAEGQRRDKLLVNVREAWLLTDSVAMGLQAELPVRWARMENDRWSGLGDMEWRTGVVVRPHPGLRWGVAANLRFDTASDPALGSGGFECRPIMALRWDAAPWLNLGLQPEYTFTANPDAEFLQVKLPVSVELSRNWSMDVVYQPKWFTHAERSRLDLVEFTLIHRFGRERRYAVLAGLELPLSEDDLDWKSFVGFQWFFR